jgi:hypothetical protein
MTQRSLVRTTLMAALGLGVLTAAMPTAYAVEEATQLLGTWRAFSFNPSQGQWSEASLNVFRVEDGVRFEAVLSIDGILIPLIGMWVNLTTDLPTPGSAIIAQATTFELTLDGRLMVLGDGSGMMDINAQYTGQGVRGRRRVAMLKSIDWGDRSGVLVNTGPCDGSFASDAGGSGLLQAAFGHQTSSEFDGGVQFGEWGFTVVGTVGGVVDSTQGFPLHLLGHAGDDTLLLITAHLFVDEGSGVQHIAGRYRIAFVSAPNILHDTDPNEQDEGTFGLTCPMPR